MIQPKITQKRIVTFQQKILRFFQQHKRDLPWRNTTDPYKILLSEIMLQQTQVTRVIDYYHQWIAQWPTLFDLAHANRKDILNAWIGLGYNSRAINLHKTAQIITKHYDGDILTALHNYEELPGIGPYTVKAVQIFATNKDISTVDTNIRRILIHEFNLPENIPQKDLSTLAERLLPRGNSREWHNALMDYGAIHLTARNTGIKPLTQQSTFNGSDRQQRGKIIRLLLQKPHTKQQLNKELHLPDERLQNILDKLLKEKIIRIQKQYYHIVE